MPDITELVTSFLGDAINARDPSAFERYCAPGYVWHGSPRSDAAVRGLAGFKELVLEFLAAFPDLEIEILGVLAGDGHATVRHQQTGTHLGEWMGVAPTGRTVSFTGIAVYRSEGGKLVEEWSISDDLLALRQLGALPPQL